jgi:perosamine synthetase
MMHIPLSRPDISEADIQAVTDVLRTPHLSLGPKLPQFEQAICEYTGARFATAVNSGTSALHLIVRALGLGAGAEVITTPFSFVASANCILMEGATPVFADVDPVTFNLDPGKVVEAITPRTKALLVVHVFGRPAAMDDLQAIARQHGLYLIEDSCEALGATWNGRALGTLGVAGTYAFYPNKQMTTGEGGAIVTDDADLDAMVKSLRNQGREAGAGWLQHRRLGFNYRLSDINCALGISQLARLDEFLTLRREAAGTYREVLAHLDRIELPAYDVPGGVLSWFVYVVRVKGCSREQRNRLLEYLRAQGVACGDYFSPIHLQPYFHEMGYKPGDFPVAESIAESTVALPFFNRLSRGEIEYVGRCLEKGLYECGISAHPVRGAVLQSP